MHIIYMNLYGHWDDDRSKWFAVRIFQFANSNEAFKLSYMYRCNDDYHKL